MVFENMIDHLHEILPDNVSDENKFADWMLSIDG